MKNRSVFIIIAAFIVLIGGAGYLYNRLSPKVSAERLSANVTPPGEGSQKIEISKASDTLLKESVDSGLAGEKDVASAGNTDSSETGTAAPNAGDAGADTEAPAADSESGSAPPAPDFTVYDIDGDAVSLSDFIGKPVVINFWASWCGPCRMEMPEFEEKYKELGGDIHFLMVNMTDGNRETRETAISFIEESGYTFPIYLDTDQDAAYTYGVYSIPSTYFIGADGTAVAMAQGAIDGSILDQGISMIYSPDNL